jgi:hypothetical protein
MSVHSCLAGWFTLSDWEHLFKILAIAAAGIFFSYKAITGYHVVNVSLKTSVDRRRIPNSNVDHLVVAVTLNKGDRGTIRLRGGSVRISPNSQVESGQAQSGEVETHDGKYLPLFGLERFSSTVGVVPGNPLKREFWRINWGQRSIYAPYLNLSPGDEGNFCAYGCVDREGVYKIDVVVIGKRAFSWKSGQWRTTSISLPEAPVDKEACHV